MSLRRWTYLVFLSAFLLTGCSCSDPMASVEDAPPPHLVATSTDLEIDDDAGFESAMSSEVKKDVPYVPTPQAVVDRMLAMATLSGDELLYDLGSGDGRIVITAAQKYGVRGVGIDIDPERIKEANDGARRAKVTDKVKFIQADLFETDLRPVTALTLYLLSSVNLRLRPKILDELRPGTPVVSHDFSMGEWEPDEHVTMDRSEIFLWIVPAKVDGSWTWRVSGENQDRSAKISQAFQKFQAEVSGAQVTETTLRGEDIGFTVSDNRDGRASTHRYKGKVNGNTITGTVEIDGKSQKWSARRAG